MSNADEFALPEPLVKLVLEQQASIDWRDSRIYKLVFADGIEEFVIAKLPPNLALPAKQYQETGPTWKTIKHPIHQSFRLDQVLLMREAFLTDLPVYEDEPEEEEEE